MALTSDITKNMVIDYKGEPYIVLEKEFYKPGKGGAFNRTKLRNIRTGSVLNITFKSNEKVESLDVNRKTMNFLYMDGEKAVFMNPTDYEQIEVNLDLIQGRTDYLHADGHYVFMFLDDEVISVEIPAKLTLEVIDTTDAVKGNTTTNATKEAILETGVKVQVPLFIAVGEKIMVNTDSNSYTSKA
jgi:elongation factor P